MYCMTAARILVHPYPQEGCAGWILGFSREATAQAGDAAQGVSSYRRTPASEPARVVPIEFLPQHPLYGLEQGKENL